jgi:hypothetical protein
MVVRRGRHLGSARADQRPVSGQGSGDRRSPGPTDEALQSFSTAGWSFCDGHAIAASSQVFCRPTDHQSSVNGQRRYVGRATLEAFRTSPGSLAVISPGEPFHVRDDRVAEWLQNWYLLRETGVPLYGAEAAATVPPIAWAEFVAATVRYADELRNRSRLGAGGGVLAYTILTLCRALRTVRTQTHGSKQEAAAWTRERMPEWAPLIDAALECRLSRGTTACRMSGRAPPRRPS